MLLNDTIHHTCHENTAEWTDAGGFYNYGGFYNGMVLPFVNMTIKGILWYQGENNVIEQEIPRPDILPNTGYGCLQKLMIAQWRTVWSVVPNTTDSLVPFGLVQLAAGTSEGNGKEMPYFRFAQSMNRGIVPNEESPNVFMAQAYDIGDPWQSRRSPHFSEPYSYNSTHWYLGCVHPRPKSYVGARLATGVNRFVYDNDDIWSGPLIKGCTMNPTHGLIRIDFTPHLLYDEHVTVQPFKLWYNESLTVKYWSAVQVLIEDKWTKLDGNVLRMARNGYSVIVNISNFTKNGLEISGISYAWSESPCCGDLDVHKYPCPMNMCPIVTSKSRLPAVPFQARIINNKCQCLAPQQCDGTAIYELPGSYNTYTTQEMHSYICVMMTHELHNYTSITGEYYMMDPHFTLWTKTIDEYETNTIFYDWFADLWNIGSVEYTKDNLICNATNVELPIDCEEWIDSESNSVDHLFLRKGKCYHLDIKQTLSEQDVSRGLFGFFDDRIRLAVLAVLLVCSCCGIICICTCCGMTRKQQKKRRFPIVNRMSKRKRIGKETVDNLQLAINVDTLLH